MSAPILSIVSEALSDGDFEHSGAFPGRAPRVVSAYTASSEVIRGPLLIPATRVMVIPASTTVTVRSAVVVQVSRRVTGAQSLRIAAQAPLPIGVSTALPPNFTYRQIPLIAEIPHVFSAWIYGTGEHTIAVYTATGDPVAATMVVGLAAWQRAVLPFTIPETGQYYVGVDSADNPDTDNWDMAIDLDVIASWYRIIGVHAPPIAIAVQSLAMQDGGIITGQRTGGRTIVIEGSLNGDTADDVAEQRARLYQVFNRDISSLPVQLRYQPQDDPSTALTIPVVYVGGLSGEARSYRDEIQLELFTPNPYWQAPEQYTSTHATSDSAPGNALLRRNAKTGQWTAIEDTDVQFRSVAVLPSIGQSPAGMVYVLEDGSPLRAWDGAAWKTVGSPVLRILQPKTPVSVSPGNQHLLVVDDNHIFAIATINDISGLWLWDGAVWVLQSPLNGLIPLCMIAGKRGEVFIGGDNYDRVNTDGVLDASVFVKWDNQTLTPLASFQRFVLGTTAVTSMTTTNEGVVYASMTVDGQNNVPADDPIEVVARYRPEIDDWDNEPLIRVPLVEANGPGMLAVDAQQAVYAVQPNPMRVIRWGGGAWTEIGNIVSMSGARAMAVQGNNVVLSGNIINADGVTVAGDSNAIQLTAAQWALVGFRGETCRNVAFTPDGDLWVWPGESAFTTATFANDFTVVNLGTADAYPIITISHPDTVAHRLYLVRNGTTGQTLYFNVLLAQGDVLSIDTRPGTRRVTLNGNNAPWALIPGGSLDAFRLLPGDNVMHAFVEQSAATITVAYAPRYLSGHRTPYQQPFSVLALPDVTTTYGIAVPSWQGLGVPPVIIARTAIVNANRDTYDSTSVRPRVITASIVANHNEWQTEQTAIANFVNTVINAGDFHLVDNGRRLSVRYAGGVEGDTTPLQPEAGTLRLLAVNPFWEAETEISVQVVPPVVTITNPGDTNVSPLIRIEATGTDATIQHITNTKTGATLQFDTLTLIAGEVVTVDLSRDAQTVTSSVRGSLLLLLADPSDLSGWYLSPGTNLVTSDIGSDVRIHLTYHAQYWSNG